MFKYGFNNRIVGAPKYVKKLRKVKLKTTHLEYQLEFDFVLYTSICCRCCALFSINSTPMITNTPIHAHTHAHTHPYWSKTPTLGMFAEE